MKNSKLSLHRTMITLLVLGTTCSCSDARNDGSDQINHGLPSNSDKGFHDQKGINENHGLNPTTCLARLSAAEREAGEENCEEISFSPNSFHVIYIKFNEGNNLPILSARHAYFKTNSKKDDVSCAVAFLKNGKPNARNNCGVQTNTYSGNKIHQNLDNMRSFGPERVYVFVDNENVGFNPHTPMTFTKWSANQNQYASPQPDQRDENLSYGKAKANYELENLDGAILYYENYYKNRLGKPMTKPDQNGTVYSINFNLLMCEQLGCDLTNFDQTFPIVIDPDTGNGRAPGPG